MSFFLIRRFDLMDCGIRRLTLPVNQRECLHLYPTGLVSVFFEGVGKVGAGMRLRGIDLTVSPVGVSFPRGCSSYPKGTQSGDACCLFSLK